MDYKFYILSRVASDRELWEFLEGCYYTIEEVRDRVSYLLTNDDYTANDLKIIKEYDYSIKVVN